MNIKITYNWLLDYLDTDATPYELQKYLSLSGPSIEKVEKIGNDYVFDVEITSNRIDTASAIGIAQEAQAILPMFDKKAKFKVNPLIEYDFKKYYLTHGRGIDNKKLNVVIKDKSLCPRFTAIVIENVKIGPSPKFISERLIVCGIKSINNVVDISNYLMLALGQPVHVFDYDEIKKQIMVMRESKKGEKIVTLDEKEVTLSGGDIVIEDGSGRLVDLCGVMGGLNSAISDKTKNVVLFVQTYDKVRIRKTTMTTGQRTIAATFFEKGLDEERVKPTLVYGVELLEKYAQGKIASKLYDIYPEKQKEKSLVMSYELFDKKVGVKIPEKTIDSILINLGFKINHLNNDRTKMVKIIVPSWRTNDVDIPEDIIEEVARVYGYHNIPSVLQPIVYIDQPKEMEDIFVFQNKIRLLLKHLGLNEVINYSMVSKEQLIAFGLDPKKHLRLSNTLSKDIEYLRTCLTISLYKNIIDNTGKKEILKLFEIGKTYQQQTGKLPKEIYKIGIATNTDYFDLKGIIEAIYKELNINELNVPEIVEKDGVFMAEIDFQSLIDNCQLVAKYKPIHPYAVIKLDKTFEISLQTTYAVVRQKAFQSKLLQKIEVITLYKNKLTLRFYYSSGERNITEEEAKKELNKVRP
ncbi:phenylalanine--tRNA ligase subunit beta [Candidatus Roizmanbacteria bacterium]|nr:phenylalanine--tRNA ligase subunit beta [Candidatus Roizmanbacteria bacterium]